MTSIRDVDPSSDGMDDDLRSLLRQGDPAHDLAPLDPHWTEWKARQIMSTQQEQDTRAARTPRPSRLRTLILAGAGVIASAATVTALALGAGGSAAVTLKVSPAAGPAAMCATITPEALQQRQTAFEARVTDIQAGQVTLEVTRVFKGEIADEVTVAQQADLPSEFSLGAFVEGERYLIALDGTTIAVCGQSGPESEALTSLYEQAFR